MNILNRWQAGVWLRSTTHGDDTMISVSCMTRRGAERQRRKMVARYSDGEHPENDIVTSWVAFVAPLAS